MVLLLRLASATHRNRLLGIFNALGPADDWNVRLVNAEDELQRILTDEKHLDGIITFMPREEKTRQLLQSTSVPTVAIGIDPTFSGAQRPNLSTVCSDSALVAQTAVDYLFSLGSFASFAFIPDRSKRPWSVERGAEFAHALRASRKSCGIYRSDLACDDDAAELGNFLKSLAKPAAVLVAHDARAIQLLQVARASGIRIPGDVCVVSIDNDELLCEHARPTLTSISLDSESVGRIAAQSLTRLMFGKAGRKSAIRKVPPLGIVERESSRPVAPAAHLINRAYLFIKSEMHRKISPADIASYLGVSRRLLDLRFRQYVHKSVTEAISDVRIAKAKQLLDQTRLTAKAVMSAVGFSDATYAHRLFKRKTGLSPLAYRANKCQPRHIFP